METQTLYKNEILWAVNKPSHTHFNEVLTHSATNEWVAAHRLDFETSGVLLHCRKSQFERILQLFKDPSFGMQKFYVAGTIAPAQTTVPGLVRGHIGSRYRRSKSVMFVGEASELRGWHSIRPAQLIIDHSERVAQIARDDLDFQGYPYEIRLITGARHQIRATLKALKAPIVGDPLYGTAPTKKNQTMELHAHRLILPANLEILQLTEPLEILASTALHPTNHQA